MPPSSTRAPDHFAVVRMCACNAAPYLSTALLAASAVPAPGIGTMSVDRWGRISYDPALFGPGPGAGQHRKRKWTYEQGAWAAIHEIWHWLRAHHERLEDAVASAEFPGVAARLANICADCEINDDLAQDGARFWIDPAPHLPSDYGWPDGLLVEQYWELLQKQVEIVDGGEATPEDLKREQPEGPQPNWLPDRIIVKRGPAAVAIDLDRIRAALRENSGSGVHGLPQPWEEPEPGDPDHDPERDALPIGRAEREQLSDQVAREIAAQAELAPGSVPAGIVRWALARLSPPQVPWERELGALVRNAVTMARGASDYSYQRPNPRGGFWGFIVPGMVRPDVQADVVIDTSASMYEPYLHAALSETEGVLRACGQRRTRVICCDAVAAPPQSVGSALDICLLGGGGTDMGAGIRAAAAAGSRVVIVLTDMATPWPRQLPSRIQLVVGAIGTEAELRRLVPTAPPYAHRVVEIRVAAPKQGAEA